MASHSDGADPSAASPAIDIMNDPTYTPDASRKPLGTGPQEPDHCRICRSEGTSDEPLYHPCKCSGSIKFVHQECLMEWLQHSQKKYCELCKTPFTFTKLYDPDMPPTLPTPLFLRQLTRRLGRDLLFWARAVAVSFVWLGCLPWCVRWMWRGWFWVSDGGWWQLQAGGLPAAQTTPTASSLLPQRTSSAAGQGIVAYLTSPVLSTLMSPVNGGAFPNLSLDTAAASANSTLSGSGHPDGIFFDHNPFYNSTRFQFVNRLLVDVLEGQLLTALIVVSFIVIFLIREWVVQQQPALVGNPADIPLLNEQAERFFAPDQPAVDDAVPDEEVQVPEEEGIAAPDQELPAGRRADDDDEYEVWMERASGGDTTETAVQDETGDAAVEHRRIFARPRRRRPRSSVADYEADNALHEAGESSTAGGLTPDGGAGNAGTSPAFNFTDVPSRSTTTRDSTKQETGAQQEPGGAPPRSASPNSMYDFGGTGASADNLFKFGGNADTWQHVPDREMVDWLDTIDTGRTRKWMRDNVINPSGSPLALERRASDPGQEGHGDGGTDGSGTASWSSAGSFEMIRQPKDKGKGREEEPSIDKGKDNEEEPDTDKEKGREEEPSTNKGEDNEVEDDTDKGKDENEVGPDISKGKGREEEPRPTDTEVDSDEKEIGKGELDVAAAGTKTVEEPEDADDESRAEGSRDVGTSAWSTTAQAGDTPVPSEASPTPPRPPPRVDSLNYEPRQPAFREYGHQINDTQGLEEIRNRRNEVFRNIDNLQEIDVGQRPQPAGPLREHDQQINDAQNLEEIRNRRLQRNEAFRNIENLQEIGVGQRPQPAAAPGAVQVRNADAAAVPQAGRAGILGWLIGDDAVPPAVGPPANQGNADAADDTDDEDPPAAPPAGVAPPLVDDDAADDFEGIMELVGMRGPLLGLVQNAAISSMLITATVAVGVAFPYVTGKTVMMILAHPILFLFRLPITAMSFCGEFLVDSATVVAFSLLLVLDQAVKFFAKPISLLLPSLSKYASSSTVTNFLKNWAVDGQNRVFAKFTSIETTYLAIRKYPPSTIPPLSMVVKESAERLQGSIGWVLEKIGLGSLASLQVSAGPEQLIVGGLNLTNPVAWAVRSWDDTFAAVNFTAPELNSTDDTYFYRRPIQVYRWSTWDKVGVVLLGYAFLSVAGMVYVRRRRAEQGSNVERQIVEFLQQCGGVMKVILIIGIEMFLFPLYCGILLDIAMLPLFETATIADRIQFGITFPFTNIFVHWFVGTCYMFHFALFVSMCRKIMRTGVLHFIRDPDDPNFHPVRDVLNRPVLTQLRKIGFSAFIYGILVLVCLGGVVWGLYGATQSVLPIHWSSNEPVFEFPVDLLFYNFLMPLAVKFFKPSEALQSLYGWWFRHCARQLRLSSFMFGERHKDEEGYTYHPTWKSFLLREKADPEKPVLPNAPPPMNEVHFRRTGRFVRAPASDTIRRPKGTPVFINVDEDNRRLDVDAEHDSTGPHHPDWRLAYIPPYFKVRIALVVVGIWVFAAATGVSVTVLPLVLGRYLLGQLVPGHVRLNDIYAFSVGVYLLGSIVLLLSKAPASYTYVKSLAQPIADAASNASYPEKLTNISKNLQVFLFRTVKIGYVLAAFAIVIPTLVAMIIELYFIIPLHTVFSKNPTTTIPAATTASEPLISLNVTSIDTPLNHTIHFIQDWTLGVLYVKMVAKMMLLDDNSIWARSLRGIIQHGWLNPDAKLATRIFIAPCVGGMLVALLLPLLFARIAVFVGMGEGAKIYRYAFPAVLLAAVVAAGAFAVWRVVERWKENVRDEVYLRGMRIHNHGEEGGRETVAR